MKKIERQNSLDEERYRSQMQAIREEAKELGVIVYLPSYHRTRGDQNTVLLYLPEDDAFNKDLDQKGAWKYAPTEAEAGYRPYFWHLENTDRNGMYNIQFANHGMLDLRPFDWEKTLKADIRLAYWKKKQVRYVAMNGGYTGLREADDVYNGMNVKIIEAMKERYGQTYLGSINGPNEIFVEYVGQPLYTGCCDFVVPALDQSLTDLIDSWRKDGKNEVYQKITDRLITVHGISILWY